MILLYDLKQVLTIGDIKSVFRTIIKEDKVNAELLARIYQIFLDIKVACANEFEVETIRMNEYVSQEMDKLEFNCDEVSDEKLSSMLEVILLTEKANYYKRLAEKIIDEKISVK